MLRKKVGDLKVKEIMDKKFKKISVDDPIKKVLTYFKKYLTNAILVYSRNKLVGKISKFSLLKLVVNPKKTPREDILKFGFKLDRGYFADHARDIMNVNYIKVKENDFVEDIALKMIQNNIMSAIVFNKKDKVTGIVTISNIIDKLLKK